jgi:hypothetical protein
MPVAKRQSSSPSGNKSSSAVSRIKAIGFDEEEGIKILLYGMSGSGKTTLWSTFPAPILVVLCSGGKNPGELRSVDTPANKSRIYSIVLNSIAEASEIIDHVRATGKYRTVVLDHATGLQDLTMKEILGLEQLPAQKSWGLASQQQWGQSTAQCKEVFRALLDLTCNVVIIAQERDFKNENDTDVQTGYVGAALTPGLAGWLHPACDYNCQTFKRAKMEPVHTKIGEKTVTTYKRGKGVEYCLRTEPHDVYMTKFRVPKGHKLPDVIIDPSYDKIIRVIKGK